MHDFDSWLFRVFVASEELKSRQIAPNLKPMSTRKIFRLNEASVIELPEQANDLEKPIQSLFEQRILESLGIRFLATEYATPRYHHGRIDTLGIDENNRPVIVEYKRSINENVLSQILYYYDWLHHNHAEFRLLVQQNFPNDAAAINWNPIRLLCVAGDYAKYDIYAAKYIGIPIEMVTYRRYGGDMIVLDYVSEPMSKVKPKSASTATPDTLGSPVVATTSVSEPISGMDVAISQLSAASRQMYEEVREKLLLLGDDIAELSLKVYVAFKRIKNFACVVPGASKVVVYLKIDPTTIALEAGFTESVVGKGHAGTGDLKVNIATGEDLVRAQPLFEKAYAQA